MKNLKQMLVCIAVLISGLNLLLLSGAYGQATISGTVSYFNLSNTPVDGIRVDFKDLSGTLLDTIHTDGNGFFCFQNVADGSYFIEPQCTKPWGGGSSVDALMMMKHFVGIAPLAGIALKAADVDASANVNSMDALADMKRFVGIITSFVSGDWAYEKDTVIVAGSTQITHNIKALCFGDVNGSYVPPPCVPHPSQANAGPDQLDIQGTSTILDANTPVSGTGVWTILSGAGGSISDPASPTSGFTGLPDADYTLAWTITTTCFSTSDTVVIGFAPAAPPPCPGIPSLVYGGRTYHTVQIGTQCWMKENLNIGTMVQVWQEQLNNSVIEKYCYNDDTVYCEVYGGLYEWNELMDYVITDSARGICPVDWHVPADEELTVLADYLGGMAVAGGKMKETGYAHWLAPNPATNSSGFTALGGGYRDASWSIFYHLMANAYFWSSSLSSPTGGPWYWKVLGDDESLQRNCNLYRGEGFSVRCLRDN